MLAVEVTDTATLAIGAPRPLFEGRYRRHRSGMSTPEYDVHSDGRRFLMVTDSSLDEIRIVLNWSEEPSARVPVP